VTREIDEHLNLEHLHDGDLFPQHALIPRGTEIRRLPPVTAESNKIDHIGPL
jgi:hypothetical protein